MLQQIGRGARAAVALAAVVLVVWAFGWQAYRFLTKKSDADGRTPIRVLHWGDKAEDDIVRRLAEDFERQPENKDIKIVRMNLGQAAAVRTKLQTMFAAGDPPDVFYLGLENVSDLAQKNLLADVEQFIAADKARGEATIRLDDFFPAVIKCFRVDGDTGEIGKGKLVGLPKDFTTVGFYYNKDLFKKAGVPEPSPTGWTWDEFITAARAIGKQPGCYGADFVSWEQMVRIYLWTHGVDFASPGWTRPYHFTDPTLVTAMTKLQGWYHNETHTLVSAKTQLETMQEPFLAGNVGMTGPYGRWKAPIFQQIEGFDWDLAPLPHVPSVPKKNGVFTVAWGIAEAGQHKSESWRFVKYLTSAKGQALMADAGLAIPVLRKVAEAAVEAERTKRPKNAGVFLTAADNAEPTDFPPDPEFQQQLRVACEEIFKLNRPIAPALDRLEREWTENARREDVASADRVVPWMRVVAITMLPLAAIAVMAAFVWWRGRPRGGELAEEVAGMGMISPWVIGFMAFTAFPVFLSLVLSFCRWSSLTTLDHAQFVGWDNFRSLFTKDATFYRALKATTWYAILTVPTGQVAALVAAMLLNRESRWMGVFRSIWYLPGVLAGVGMAVMWKWVFHHEHGLLKAMLDPILPAALHMPACFEKDAETWGVPAFAFINLWAIGGTMMIYLAGLKGIPKDLYEAAEIDGALGWKRFRNVTLPMLSPVLFFNFIMAIIGSFQVFTQAYVMTGGGPGHSTRFYVVYLYNQAFDFHEMGYSSAMAWLLLLIILALTLVVMKGTKRFVYYEGLKS